MTIRLLKSIFIIICLWLCSCAGPEPDTRLVRIEEMASVSPEEALDSLNAIQYDKLKPADKHYYDFLSVKVPDKAYINHSSDSLILKVIDYESRHPETGRYVEALYYGARVYSDLGDYPTALQYFHQTIDTLPDLKDKRTLELKTRILSQAGRLSNSLRQFDDAVKYVESAIETEKIINDSIGIANDLMLLGGIYLRMADYDTAIKYLKLVLTYCKGNNILKACSNMYIAEAEYRKGNNDIALTLIRKKPDEVDSISRRYAISSSANIYLNAGKLDTAYMYAKELISQKDNYTSCGYHVLLNSRLRKYLSPDSLVRYVYEYVDVLETGKNQNQVQITAAQKAYYNYNKHKSLRVKAEKANSNLWLALSCGMIVILILVTIVLIQKNRNKNTIIKLQRALENITQLELKLKTEKLKEESIQKNERNNLNDNDERLMKEVEISKPTVEELRNDLKKKLLS